MYLETLRILRQGKRCYRDKILLIHSVCTCLLCFCAHGSISTSLLPLTWRGAPTVEIADSFLPKHLVLKRALESPSWKRGKKPCDIRLDHKVIRQNVVKYPISPAGCSDKCINW